MTKAETAKRRARRKETLTEDLRQIADRFERDNKTIGHAVAKIAEALVFIMENEK